MLLRGNFDGLPLWLSWERICLQCRRSGFSLWVGKIPWRRERLPTPVFWPGEFQGLYSPWDLKESNTTEQLSLHFVIDKISKLKMCLTNAFCKMPKTCKSFCHPSSENLLLDNAESFSEIRAWLYQLTYDGFIVIIPLYV